MQNSLNSKSIQHLSSTPTLVLPKNRPTGSAIAHFGVGAFHRSHQALYTQLAMDEDQQQCEWGIIGVGIMPFDLKMNKVLNAQDFLYTLVEKAPEGEPVYRIISSITQHIYAVDDIRELVTKVGAADVKIITLTITEGGYYLKKDTGELDIMDSSIQHDIKHWRNEHPKSIFGYLARIMEERKTTHGTGITILSCDNIQHNGRVIEKTFLSFLAAIDDASLLLFVKEHCTFPNSMVDRITPQTPASLLDDVEKKVGLRDEWPVAGEDFKQWVIEDKFACGRPAWEKAGAQFVPDVSPYEKMKLRVLNGSHQALCYLGSLAGLTYVHEAAQDPTIKQFLQKYMVEEVRETLDPVPGIDIPEYEKTIISRFSNSNVKDTLSRICEYTSDRIPLFNVPSMSDMRKKAGKISCSALIVASWIAYAQGIDNKGNQLPLVDNRRE